VVGLLVQYLLIAGIPILLAITLHEAAHGYTARHFGDTTAERAGRLSLNPIRHIDLVGTILVPIVMLAISLAAGTMFIFGWAKPVPVNFAALRNPKKDMFWVALAGPAANVLMVLAWALAAKVSAALGGEVAAPFYEMAVNGMQINAIFVLLNLIPLPPLDGGRIAVSLLPYRAARQFSQVEPYGIFILIILLTAFGLGQALFQMAAAVVTAIKYIFGL
jgi:Zn-dependent protease